jgi:hypothetical protein
MRSPVILKSEDIHMLISDKQHEANCKNAQNSCGPKTPEGKAAVRLNALIYGLRARTLIIPGENQEEYQQSHDTLVSELQPIGEVERMQIQQMAIAHWLLARIAYGESRIYQEDVVIERQLSLLRQVGTERTRLERSFYTALHELQRLQEKREAKAEKQAQAAAAQTKPAAKPPARQPEPPPAYVMSEPAADPAIFCAPTPDTR